MIRFFIALCACGFALAASAQDVDRAAFSGMAFERLRAECVAFKAASHLRRFDGKAGPHECMDGEVRLFAHLSGGASFDPARLLATQPPAAGDWARARGVPAEQLERACAAAKALYAHLGFDVGDMEDPGYDAKACTEIELLLYRREKSMAPGAMAAAGQQASLRKRVIPPNLFQQDRDSGPAQASD